MRLPSLGTTSGLIIVLALYLVSFHQPAIFFRVMSAAGPQHSLVAAGNEVKSGKQMALGSLGGPFFGNFAGLANPLLLVGSGLLLMRKTRGAVLCLALATLFALQTFQLMLLPYHEDEGGVLLSYMVRPLAGWYCWFGAMLLALLLAVAQRAIQRKPTSHP